MWPFFTKDESTKVNLGVVVVYIWIIMYTEVLTFELHV